ncbi:tetratricopeptide repeat protein 17-like [Centruroides sculpturatus]|uniref:tetratricopeptide repeat protein 17-like n=1 Tax=Centruroides sculpturatus TaxID=218467 RepID=UPI000C6DFE19|nr:tetratricopeptide repeat protein 17-like [Centruroides sculpturatus]
MIQQLFSDGNLQSSDASTHWVVTENGKIQAQIDSVFSLRRPYDLVALMQQEQRAILVEELKQQLMMQKEEIDLHEDKETNLEGKMYSMDEDCLAAGKPLTDIDLYVSTIVPFDYKGLNGNNYLGNSDPSHNLLKPNCSGIIELPFSMHAFEHLMNHTSWILFNMAAYYWRVHGDADNAIECVRRALHFSPREHKDVALISLGNILHHAHQTEEAAIVVHAAIDIAPDNAICHFTLGNIYAVLTDYNKSRICFENTLKVQPDFKNAEQRLHAVLCHNKLEKALEAQHNSLQRTLSELREYQKQHEFWLRQHEKLLNEQAPPEVKLEQRLEYEEQKIRESLDGRGQDCFQFEQNGHTVLSCNMRRETYHQGSQAQLDLSLNLQLIQAVESRAGRLGQKMATKVSEHCQKS